MDNFKFVENVFDIPKFIISDDIEEAKAFLEDVGNVAVKTTKNIHKTEEKGVFTNIYTQDALLSAFEHITERFGGPVLIQEMVNGVELFVGGKRDPQFGPVVLFGIGGIYVEAYADISARVAPFSKEEAIEMINEIKGQKIIRGLRGRYVDVDKLAERLSVFSETMHSSNIEEIDINPLVATKDRFYAVDVRLLSRK